MFHRWINFFADRDKSSNSIGRRRYFIYLFIYLWTESSIDIISFLKKKKSKKLENLHYRIFILNFCFSSKNLTFFQWNFIISDAYVWYLIDHDLYKTDFIIFIFSSRDSYFLVVVSIEFQSIDSCTKKQGLVCWINRSKEFPLSREILLN